MWQGQQPPQQPYYPQDPNQQAYYGQPGYPPQQPGYPPQQPGYPPQQPGYPPQPGFQQQPGFPYNPAYPHQMPNIRPQPPYMDPEDPDAKNFEFSDESIRKGFIKKVYSILCVQLTFTVGIIALFTYHQPTKTYVTHHPALMWVALGILFVTMIVLACCESVRRTSPMNFVCLGIYTLAQGFILGVVSAIHDPETVIMAAGLTAVVCFGLTLFAFQTKWDFTVMGGVLLVAAIILMVFGIVAIFFPGKTIRLVYASFGALLFCIYLIYDTQMMMGGKHKYSISPEEYIFAALNLYVDIVNIFMYILMILGASRD